MAKSIREELNSKENYTYSEYNDSKNKNYFLLIILFVIIIFIISTLKDSFLDNYFKKEKVVSSGSDRSTILEVYDPVLNSNTDSDGDGVPNWREVVLGEDPNTKNTNPYINNYVEQPANYNSNFTTLLARDLYTIGKYEEKYKNINGSALSSSLVDEYKKLLLPSRSYALDIKSGSDFEYLKGFGNGIAVMFLAIFENSNFVEIEEMEKGDNKFVNTKIFLERLTEVCSAGKIAKNIPAEFESAHKDFVYNCELYKNILTGMVNNKEDSVKALIAINMHRETLENIYKNFLDYKNVLTSKNVFYKSDEYGNVFNSNLN